MQRGEAVLPRGPKPAIVASTERSQAAVAAQTGCAFSQSDSRLSSGQPLAVAQAPPVITRVSMSGPMAGWALATGMGGAAAGRRLPSRLPLAPPPRRAYALHSRPLPGPTCAAALPSGGVGAAAKAAVTAQAAVASLHGCIDPVVLAATTNASFKLFLICAVVGWLLKTGRIPNSTATVMSKVGQRGPACWQSGLCRQSGLLHMYVRRQSDIDARQGIAPKDVASASLLQISFELLIPAMLFSKVGRVGCWLPSAG